LYSVYIDIDVQKNEIEIYFDKIMKKRSIARKGIQRDELFKYDSNRTQLVYEIPERSKLLIFIIQCNVLHTSVYRLMNC